MFQEIYLFIFYFIFFFFFGENPDSIMFLLETRLVGLSCLVGISHVANTGGNKAKKKKFIICEPRLEKHGAKYLIAALIAHGKKGSK